MRKMSLILISCSLVCIGAYRWGDMKWEYAKQKAMEVLYMEVSQFMAPYIRDQGKATTDLVFEDVEAFFMPLVSEFRVTKYNAMVNQREDKQEEEIPQFHETTEQVESIEKEEETKVQEDTTESNSIVVSGVTSSEESIGKMEKKVTINRVKLQDFDYLRQNFYQVDNTTTVDGTLLNVTQLLEKDMKIQMQADGPQILIYHTHSQEGYKDSISGDASTTIVGVGDYLEQLLEEKYGIEVLHHTGVYDLPKRDNAYSMALPNLEQVLQENPSIEVVIDLHRDGVAEDRHLVTEVDGKQTAKLMFFNGLCKTTAQGELSYLPNPYITDNLAFSFQLHLAAEEYYPGLMRKIYLKGYRYNLHLKPKSVLVEVGAQTNTLEEAKNAMEPLANILAFVLSENDSTNGTN